MTVPYDYLRQVGARLEAPYLRPDEQSAVLGTLEYALANEHDPTVGPYVLHLARRLLARPDLTPHAAERARALLWSHEQRHQSAQASPFAQATPTPAPSGRTRPGVIVAVAVGAVLVLGLLVGGVAVAQGGSRPSVAPPPTTTTSAPPQVTATVPSTTTTTTPPTQSNRTGVTISGPTTARVGDQSDYTVDGPSTNTNCYWVLSGNGLPDSNHSGCDGVTVTWRVAGTYYLAVAWTDTVTGRPDSTVVTLTVR